MSGRIELSELSESLLRVFGADSVNDFPAHVMDAVTSGDPIHRDRVFNDYLEAVSGDLSRDFLQPVFQYHLADRTKGKSQDFTPPSLAKLLSALVGDAEAVYDLCAGSGALTIQKWVDHPNAVYYCEELDDQVIPLLLFNLAVRNIDGWVIHRDALGGETFVAYQVCATISGFSDVHPVSVSEVPEVVAQTAISNPPYNIPWTPPAGLLIDDRFANFPIPPASNANYAFILTALHRVMPGGKCALILPNGVLTGSGAEKDIRRQLVEAGLIGAVIILPERMFEGTSIPVSVLLLGENHGLVRMHDARKRGTVEVREQRGQYGGNSHTARVYRKEIQVLDDQLIRDLVDGVGGYLASVDEIAENDWNLTPSRYIDHAVEDAHHRPFGDIMDDINRICSERNSVKITLNESVARTLGMSEIHESMTESNKIITKQEPLFAIFGKQPVKSDYLALSKNKNEIRIENKNKHEIPAVFSIFLPMWSQHLHYLNTEENRLLAELRDALLPEMMSGRIEVPTVEPQS